jgi:hypothetical protein
MLRLLPNRAVGSGCRKCNIGHAIRRFIVPLFQLLTLDIPGWSMKLLTTKCLNTSVALTWLLLGDKGLRNAEHCDVSSTRKRHRMGVDTNTGVARALVHDILHAHDTQRQLFYILMTDADFPFPRGDDRPPARFVGHVFLIEKIPPCPGSGTDQPTFMMYQSYIGRYTLSGHMANLGGTLEVPFARMARWVEGIQHAVTCGVWDERCVALWDDMCNVDSRALLGSITRDHLLLCYRKSALDLCMERLTDYLKDKRHQLLTDDTTPMGEVWGDPNLYDAYDARPLTKAQLISAVEDMLRVMGADTCRLSADRHAHLTSGGGVRPALAARSARARGGRAPA